MDTQQVKDLIALKVKKLTKEFNSIVDNEDRETPMDYARPALIEGKINALTELLVEIDRG